MWFRVTWFHVPPPTPPGTAPGARSISLPAILIIAAILVAALPVACTAADPFLRLTLNETKVVKQMAVNTIDIADASNVSRAQVIVETTAGDGSDTETIEFPQFSTLRKVFTTTHAEYLGNSIDVTGPADSVIPFSSLPPYRKYILPDVPTPRILVPGETGLVTVTKSSANASISDITSALQDAKVLYLYTNSMPWATGGRAIVAIFPPTSTTIIAGDIESDVIDPNNFTYTFQHLRFALDSYLANDLNARDLSHPLSGGAPLPGLYMVDAFDYDQASSRMISLTRVPLAILTADNPVRIEGMAEPFVYSQNEPHNLVLTVEDSTNVTAVAWALLRKPDTYALRMDIDLEKLLTSGDATADTFGQTNLPVLSRLLDSLKGDEGSAWSFTVTAEGNSTEPVTAGDILITPGYGYSGHANGASSVTIPEGALQGLIPGTYYLYAIGLDAEQDLVALDQTELTVTYTPPVMVANFTGSPTSGTAPLAVQFTDHSTGSPTSWQWDFGDGSSASDQNPSHTYLSAGTYSVNLTVSNGGGSAFLLRSGYISVGELPPLPIASFTGLPTSGTAPLAVQFTDHSTGSPTSWQWDFGDGSSASDQNPSHTYLSAGTFSVNLTVSNVGGNASLLRSGYISVSGLPPRPVAAFSAAPTTGYAPLAVQFTDHSTGSPLSWQWDFGDGTGSMSQSPVHQYGAAGNYSVTLTVANGEGTDTLTREHYILVMTPSEPPVAAFGYEPASGYAPLTVQFTDRSTGSPYAWLWDFGDGLGSTDRNPGHTYSGIGVYTVSLTAWNGAGQNTTIQPNCIIVTDQPLPIPPTADFSGSPLSGVAPLSVAFLDQSTGHPTSWLWAFGDGEIATTPNPTHTYQCEGVYTVSLTVGNSGGTDIKARQGYITVTGAPPQPLAAAFSGTPLSGNAPLSVQFTDQSSGDPVSWEWQFGDGTGSTDRHPVHLYTTAGTYTVSLTARNTTASNTTVKTGYISVGGSPSGPTADFSGSPLSGPSPLTVTFLDHSTGTPTFWHWEFGDGQTSTNPNPVHTYSGTGSYTVSLTVANPHGTDTRTRQNYVTVGGSPSGPTADFSGSPLSGPSPLTVTFLDHSTGTPTFWHWEFGDGQTSTNPNPVHTYSGTGSYTVSLTVANPHGTDTRTRQNYVTVATSGVLKAAFTSDVTSGQAPLRVLFTDQSSGNPSSWHWEFGDGGTSESQNPVHQYLWAGNFSVSLRVRNQSAEDELLRAGYITVTQEHPSRPVASFNANPVTGSAPLAVQFTDTSSGVPSTWDWNFGDGTANATVKNPSHTFALPGTYSVTLTAGNSYGSDTRARSGLINVSGYTPLFADFTASPREGYSPLAVQFNDTSTGSPTSWQWDFGDGTSSAAMNPVHTFTLGTFTINLTVSGAAGTNTTTKKDYIVAYRSGGGGGGGGGSGGGGSFYGPIYTPTPTPTPTTNATVNKTPVQGTVITYGSDNTTTGPITIRSEDGIVTLALEGGATLTDAEGKLVKAVDIVPVEELSLPPLPMENVYRYAGIAYLVSPERMTITPDGLFSLQVPQAIWDNEPSHEFHLLVYNPDKGSWEELVSSVSESSRTVSALVRRGGIHALFMPGAAVTPVTTTPVTTTTTPTLPPTTGPLPPPPPGPTSTLPLLLIIGAAVVIGGVIAGIVYLKQRKQEEPEEDTVEEEMP